MEKIPTENSAQANLYQKEAQALDKVPTGIRGLDDVLAGGIPLNRTTIIRGASGVGKSVLSMEIAQRSILKGNPVIFITFEEKAEDVYRNALTFGWDFKAAEKEGLMTVYSPQVDHGIKSSGDFDINGLKAIVAGQARNIGAGLVIIDSLDVLMDMFGAAMARQNEVYNLRKWFDQIGLSTLLTVKSLASDRNFKDLGFLEFLADCVIYLEEKFEEDSSARFLWVNKYRGSGYLRKKQPFIITDRGLTVLPVKKTRISQDVVDERVSLGHEKLDEIVGGGLLKASTLLVAGVTGAGKTALACTYTRAACQRGEKVLYIAYEESPETLLRNVLSLGLDLKPALDQGLLRFVSILPESLGIDEHLYLFQLNVEEFRPDHVIVDAVSACRRIEKRARVSDYLLRLVDLCRTHGITAVLVSQIFSAMGIREITGAEVSSLIDSIIFLGVKESAGEMNRRLVITKSRGSNHSNRFYEFVLSGEGIVLSEPYIGPEGVLTGSAKKLRLARSRVEMTHLDQLLENKKLEAKRKKVEMEVAAAQLQTQIEAVEAEMDLIRSRKEALSLRSTPGKSEFADMAMDSDLLGFASLWGEGNE